MNQPPSSLPPVVPTRDRTATYVTVVGAILAMAIAAIVALALLTPPGRDSNPTILVVVGMTAPTVAGVLALLKGGENADGIKGVHVDLNSRLSQLLERTAAASRAEGVAVGQSNAGALAGPVPITPEATAAALAIVLAAAAAARVVAERAAADAATAEAAAHPPAAGGVAGGSP